MIKKKKLWENYTHLPLGFFKQHKLNIVKTLPYQLNFFINSLKLKSSFSKLKLARVRWLRNYNHNSNNNKISDHPLAYLAINSSNWSNKNKSEIKWCSALFQKDAANDSSYKCTSKGTNSGLSLSHSLLSIFYPKNLKHKHKKKFR
jgi:hypothetical protein